MTKINIYHGDSLKAMQSMEDKRYGLAICDPEYGIGKDGNRKSTGKHGGRKAHKLKDWDKKRPSKKYFDLLFKISCDQIIWGGNYFTKNLPASMGWIFWDKGQRIKNSDGELAFTSFDRALRVYEINRVQLQMEGETFHPTTKPIKLYKWLLKNYGYNKDGTKRTILDTHGGSFSIVLACIDMGFDIDIWEIDQDYYTDAVNRVKRHLAQQDLTREPVEINYL